MSLKLKKNPFMQKRSYEDLLKENAELKAKLNSGRFMTAEQLKEFEMNVRKHDRLQCKAAVAKWGHETEKKLNENTDAYFQERRDLFLSDSKSENFMNYVALLLQIVVEVMAREFGWTVPLNDDWGDRRFKINKLIHLVLNDVCEIAQSDDTDLVMEGRKAAERMHVAFELHEEG